MACEACSTKFNLFKRKKQCMDCLRYFCSECVIKRLDKVFACDSCSILSRRPLVRNQIRQMRSRDLRQYLVAKKVSIKGCVEKEDLVHVLMLFANGTDPCLSTDCCTNVSSQNATRESLSRVGVSVNRPEDMPNVSAESEVTRDDAQAGTEPTASEDIEIAEEVTESDSSPVISVPLSTDDNESPSEDPRNNNVEIEEVFECDSSATDAPEPVITEQDEVSETPNRVQSDMVTEIPTWPDKVQLSDIKEASELEYLNIKQLKSLLSINRVDYKGCVERQELLNRVSRLWHEYKQSRKDVEGLSEEEICKICWDAPIECVILECGHMACCINCGKQMSECPICKQYVVRVVRFFKA
ncbi:E3 ubiquitin-protein ligase RNF34 isoform X2 [Harpegnathos saltator]|uniref:E3 ubiquitin-protein ligase rififylin n=2 Tax=Harpegnathos saltator TaxID=610380 RepID=E2C8N1_HARSA|nr:E3 ubiquitin-protein ligase RNF34 isoform X2 [Harpegnathos saltator]EFN75761.1 E3 ubiquitin-protein ligase rififylin [Harpegnathos saltator]